jgi:uncharacterized linocin/CFP29 family protein
MSASDLLKRKFAPILPEAWEAIDAEAARVLKLNLAGRKIVDFQGPFGWHFAAVNTGRLTLLPEVGDPDLNVGVRNVQPLVEIRVPIKLSLLELDSVARGAGNPRLEPVVKAAEKIARAEDHALFAGFAPAGIAGMVSASPHRPLPLPASVSELPRTLLAGKELLRQAGISGPYALVLGAALYDQVYAATEEGHSIAKRIEQLLVDRPIVRAPALDGGVLLSVRGGDYQLTVGQDLSIGYAYHDKHDIELYVTESFTFRVLEPAAAIAFRK